MSSIQIRVCGRFRIQQKLYQGRHSSVYIGKNVQSGTDCAIKCQPKSSHFSFVMNQGRVLQQLQGGVGIPSLLWFGQNGDFRFLVTELMGNTLQDYFDICGRKFSLKTVLMVADKILSSLEFIHYKNYIHRDIKPENFLVGLGRKLTQIYTIDMAYATPFSDPKTKQHRPDSILENQFVGTLRFASLNVHRGHRNSRRDDLQSVGLMMIYFLKGNLPWSSAQGQSLKEKRQNIRKIMQKITVDQLCQGLPVEIKQYMDYCRNLKFEEKPDYNYLKRLFKEKFVKQGYQYDNIYDWILIPLRLKDTQLSNRVPISRFAKKEDSSLSMCNCDYDFKVDAAFEEKINKKDQQKPANLNVSQPQQNNQSKNAIQQRGRAISQGTSGKGQPSQPQNKKTTGKNGKQDCIIY